MSRLFYALKLLLKLCKLTKVVKLGIVKVLNINMLQSPDTQTYVCVLGDYSMLIFKNITLCNFWMSPYWNWILLIESYWKNPGKHFKLYLFNTVSPKGKFNLLILQESFLLVKRSAAYKWSNVCRSFKNPVCYISLSEHYIVKVEFISWVNFNWRKTEISETDTTTR